MKLTRAISAFAIAITATIAIHAEQPARQAHIRAHEHHNIARNTPAISPSGINPYYSAPEATAPAAKAPEAAPASRTSRIVDDLLTEARKHIGKPYVHGSKGPSSFDCSGFSSYVYRQFGYKLSPASRAQATEGVAVAPGDLRKGDLVFFTSRSSGGAVGHVGIVVSADNATGSFSFIHASIKGVKISRNEGYYKSRYLGARRIITE